MKSIYKPKGKAKEYGDYAINIYTGCPHRCYYCFAPSVIRREREIFHANVIPRNGIVEAVKKQLKDEKITNKLIHLCFTCDPYPTGCNTIATRDIIEAIKESGNNVQILTKGDGSRDFDLLDRGDWYGITLSGATYEQEPNALKPMDRLLILAEAKETGIKTWVSFEPVINTEYVLHCLSEYGTIFNKVKIGKLNYHPSNINWNKFGNEVENLCKSINIDYYIKESLREIMYHQI